MIRRTLARSLREAARSHPVASLTGPRQAGKTTLVQSEFPRHAYVSLELPDQRAFAQEDPRGFLAQFDEPVILDEVQRVPELFSYIQVLVDASRKTGRFILTGSQNFLLMQQISQSLAGRCAVLHLLPLSLSELQARPAMRLEAVGETLPRRLRPPAGDLTEILHTGFFPRIA